MPKTKVKHLNANLPRLGLERGSLKIEQRLTIAHMISVIRILPVINVCT